MNKSAGITLLASVAIVAILSTRPADTQGPTPRPSVWLQDTSPGTLQPGHTNVAGTVRASQFVGGGTGLTALDANNITSGKINLTDAQFSSAMVYGGNTAASGAIGVYGQTTSTGLTGTGVQGESAGSNGIGVYGVASHTTGANHGLWGVSLSNNGIGVYGASASNDPAGSLTRYGVMGESFRGTGVFGIGRTTGVHGKTSSSSGTAVYGEAIGGGFGVHGSVLFASGTGVVGDGGVGGTGVYGSSITGGGFGVYSAGNFGASGNKSFRIDHPLDPQNKYLAHYCTEGPEPQNVYNGTVTTDPDGFARVALPDYFDAINKNARIQLTVVDTEDLKMFVLAKVIDKVQTGSFAIRTSAPNTEVYWEVKATRNDLWTKKHGAPIEFEKAEHERGKYQHPELYGAPPTKGIGAPGTRK